MIELRWLVLPLLRGPILLWGTVLSVGMVVCVATHGWPFPFVEAIGLGAGLSFGHSTVGALSRRLGEYVEALPLRPRRSQLALVDTGMCALLAIVCVGIGFGWLATWPPVVRAIDEWLDLPGFRRPAAAYLVMASDLLLVTTALAGYWTAVAMRLLLGDIHLWWVAVWRAANVAFVIAVSVGHLILLLVLAHESGGLTPLLMFGPTLALLLTAALIAWACRRRLGNVGARAWREALAP